MDINKLHQEVENLIERIAFLNEDFTSKSDVSQLEIDVLRKYCIELYDVVNKIGLASKISQAQKKNTVTPSISEDLNEGNMIENSKLEPAIEKESQKQPVQPTVNKPQIQNPEPPRESKNEEKVEVEIIKPTMDLTKEPQDKLIPQETQKFIAQLMEAENSNKSLFEKYKTSPIESVSQGISVLKRFEYQSGLFNGNVEAYNTFLSQIESAGSLTNAVKILNDNKNSFNWDDELLEAEINNLVYRRYMNVPI